MGPCNRQIRNRHAGFRIALSLAIWSALISASIADDLSFSACATVFPDPSLGGLSAVQFTISFAEAELTYLPDKSTSVEMAGIFAQVIVSSASGAVVDSAQGAIAARRSFDTPNDQTALVYQRLTLQLAPGSYTASVSVLDATSKKNGSLEFDQFEVAASDLHGMSLSGLELAYTFSESPKNSANDPLMRHGLRILTNTSGSFDIADSAFAIYCELYGAAASSSAPREMSYTIAMRGPKDTSFADILASTATLRGSSAVIARKVPMRGISSGAHHIRLIASCAGLAADTAVRPITFREARPLAASDTSSVADFYDQLSSEAKGQVAFWVMGSAERKLFSGLTPDGKTAFLGRFWADRDSDTTSVSNPARELAVRLYLHAVDRFSTSVKIQDGWKTDRGRVLLTYGEPDEITDAPAPSLSTDLTGFNAWERWSYNKKSWYFVFAEDVSYGEFKLAHSNAPGEKFDHGIDALVPDIFGSRTR